MRRLIRGLHVRKTNLQHGVITFEFRQSEVRHFDNRRVVTGEEDIVGLEVTVDDSLAVDILGGHWMYSRSWKEMLTTKASHIW